MCSYLVNAIFRSIGARFMLILVDCVRSVLSNIMLMFRDSVLLCLLTARLPDLMELASDALEGTDC